MTASDRPSGRSALFAGLVLVAVPWLLLALLGRTAPTVVHAVEPSAIEADGDRGWLLPFRSERVLGRLRGLLFEFPTDHAGGSRSELRLFEDDRELGPGHVPHTELREFGAGRFSHWDRNLYFSTSDGTDPRSNGRRYRVETPTRLSRGAGFIALALSLVGAIIAWCSAPARRGTRAWRERWLEGGLAGAPGDGIGSVEPTPVDSTSTAHAAARVTLAPAWRLALLALWTLCAVTAVWIGRGERDPYLLSTVPTAGFGDHSNSLPGYSVFLDGTPRHQENLQTWDHVAMFNGAGIAADMYANRPLYPFLVSLASWLLGVGGACLAVNLAAWALGAWAAVRIGAELAENATAGIAAGALACVGPGWWFHVGDYSAHLLSFATYAVALLVLLRSRVWSVRRPAEVHAAIAAVLGVASLAYNSGLFATAAYALLAIWRNRWWHVALAVIYAVVLQRLWTPLLNLLSDGVFDYYAVERQLFEGAKATWSVWLADGTWLTRSVDVMVDGLVPIAVIVPLVLFGALAPLLGGRRTEAAHPSFGAVLLMLMAIAIPIAATIVYSPTATARGYLVFGGGTAAWALAGLLLARLRPGAWRGLGAGLLLLAIVVQLGFDTRHASGDARAVKLYMWGQPAWDLDSIRALRASQPTTVLGLAGEETPAIAGGARPLVEVGGYDGGRSIATLPAFKNGIQFGQLLCVRGFVALALLAALHLVRLAGLIGAGRRRLPVPLVSALLAGVVLLPPFLARFRSGGTVIQRHDLFDRALPGRSHEVVLEVDVAPASLLALERLATESPHLAADILTGFGWSDRSGDGVSVAVSAGAVELARFDTESTGRRRRPIDLAQTVEALRQEPRLRVTATRPNGVAAVSSWQRGDAPGRRLRLDGAEAPREAAVPMPIIELRVFDPARSFDPRLLLY